MVREATQAGILVGLAEVSGVRPRQDIDVYLREDPKGFNLMILALKHLQETSVDPETGLPSTKPEHILSYYELAGRVFSRQCGNMIDLFARNTRISQAALEQCQSEERCSRKGGGVLPARENNLSAMAPSVSCSVRGRTMEATCLVVC